MFKAIRKWLLLDTIKATNIEVQRLNAELRRLHENVRSDLQIHNLALGRIIAKLDPAYAKDPLSVDTKAESDKIAEQVLSRLRGEHKASNPYG